MHCCASQRRACLSEADRRRVTPEHYFKSAAEMRALFADLPEACDNTLAIARSCAVMAETRKAAAAGVPQGAAGQYGGADAACHGRGRAWSGAWMR